MRLNKNHRLAAMAKILTDSPNKLITLGEFAEKFSSSKPTISADISSIRSSFEENGLGEIKSIAGAGGGVMYVPKMRKEDMQKLLDDLSLEMGKKERALPGGYIYLLDLIYNPKIADDIGRLLASVIDYSNTDYIVTIETKGIPLAYAVARQMNLPIAIIRKNTRITEGPSITTSYVAGSSSTNAINTISLPIRAIERGKNVIVIDDFLRGGKTMKGIGDLMDQFDATILKTAVFAKMENDNKDIDSVLSIIDLKREDGKITAKGMQI